MRNSSACVSRVRDTDLRCRKSRRRFPLRSCVTMIMSLLFRVQKSTGNVLPVRGQDMNSILFEALSIQLVLKDQRGTTRWLFDQLPVSIEITTVHFDSAKCRIQASTYYIYHKAMIKVSSKCVFVNIENFQVISHRYAI